MSLESDVAVIKEVVVRVEAHVEELNGTVAELKRDHLIQKGWLQAMGSIMAVTLAVGSAVGIIEAIARWG